MHGHFPAAWCLLRHHGWVSWQVMAWQGDSASALSCRPCPRSAVWEEGRHSPLLCSSSTWR